MLRAQYSSYSWVSFLLSQHLQDLWLEIRDIFINKLRRLAPDCYKKNAAVTLTSYSNWLWQQGARSRVDSGVFFLQLFYLWDPRGIFRRHAYRTTESWSPEIPSATIAYSAITETACAE